MPYSWPGVPVSLRYPPRCQPRQPWRVAAVWHFLRLAWLPQAAALSSVALAAANQPVPALASAPLASVPPGAAHLTQQAPGGVRPAWARCPLDLALARSAVAPLAVAHRPLLGQA